MNVNYLVHNRSVFFSEKEDAFGARKFYGGSKKLSLPEETAIYEGFD